MTKTILEEFVELYKEADGFYDDIEEVDVIEDGDWTQEGKYQYSQSIVKFKDTFIQISMSRSGSPFTDWYYDDTEISVVEEQEEIKVIKQYYTIGESITVPGE